MHTCLATTDSLTLPTNYASAMVRLVRYALLFALAALLLGCGSSEPSTRTTPLEKRYPLLECDGGRYDQYLTVTVAAKSLQLDLVRRKVIARGQSRILAKLRGSAEEFFSERRLEQFGRNSAQGLQGQMADSLKSSVLRAAGGMLGGIELIRCNTKAGKLGEARLYRMTAHVGLPVNEAASKFARRVSQNPTLQKAFEDSSEIREVIRQWLRWSLTRGAVGGGATQGTRRN